MPQYFKKESLPFYIAFTKGPPFDTLTVTVAPDPIIPGEPAVFSISGALSKDISVDSLYDVAFVVSSQIVAGSDRRYVILPGIIRKEDLKFWRDRSFRP